MRLREHLVVAHAERGLERHAHLGRREVRPRGHALLLHGNGGNVTLLAPTIRILNRKHNLAVLALDYRGFGKSEGKPSEDGVLMDARAARKWLASKCKIAESDALAPDVASAQRLHRLIEQDPPLVDHDHALAHLLHVRGVVRGQQQGAAVALGLFADQRADHRLGADVEPDRGLVE